jgi:GLPGLI family protein
MKYIIFLIIFACNSILSAQNYKLTYEIVSYKNINADKYESDDTYLFLKNLSNLIKKGTNNLKIDVYANTSFFYFRNEEKLKNDANNFFSSPVIFNLLGLKENYYSKDNSTYYYNNNHSFITKIDGDSYEWNITSDTKKKINKYECINANLIIESEKKNYLQNYNVWFAPQVNIKGGPTLFSNIPGLIIELENTFVKIQLTKIEVVNKELLLLKDFIKDMEVKSFEESESYYKEIMKNIQN